MNLRQESGVSRLIPVLWVCGFFLASQGRSQTSQIFYAPASQVNTTGYTTLSARTAVFGAAFTGIADDSSALFSNPAGLAFLSRGQISLHTQLGLGDSLQQMGVAGLPLGRAGGMGLAGSYLSYGNFTGRDESGSLAPDYGAYRLDFQAGWGLSLTGDWSVGAAIHCSQQTIAGNSTSFYALNFGTLWKAIGNLKLGLDYDSAGWNSTANPGTSTLTLAAALDEPLDSSLRLLPALGFSTQSNAQDYLQGGAELSYGGKYFLRAGYSAPFQSNGGGGFSGFSAGGGLVLGDFALDYAYLPAGDLGDSNRFSLTYLFGKEEETSNSIANSKLSSSESLTGTSAVLSPPSSRISAANPNGGSMSTSSKAPVTVFAQPPQPEGASPQTETGKEAKNSLTLKFDIPADFTSQGDQLEAQGRSTDALRLYRQAVQQDPQNVMAWWGMGKVYSELGKRDYAIRCFKKVLELRPDNKALREWLDKYKAQQP